MRILTKRLSDKQKKEILESFECGQSVDFLSKEYNCTKLTVTRNLKKNLGELKYKEILNKNKSSKGKPNAKKNKNNNFLNKNLDNKVTIKNSNDIKKLDKNIVRSDFEPVDYFLEIAPLDYQIENASRKELSSVPISKVEFPKTVFMIVDKKIEIEIKLLKDFPEWDFLPNIDLNRKAIEIYSDLNIAKRSCNKDQKVIKVPNTNVFKIVAPILTARGISRIVYDENLIAL